MIGGTKKRDELNEPETVSENAEYTRHREAKAAKVDGSHSPLRALKGSGSRTVLT